MTGQELLHIREQRLGGFVSVVVVQEVEEPPGIHPAADIRKLEQRVDFRRKGDAAGRSGMVQRLDAEGIAGEKQPLLHRVVHRKGEHADEARQHRRPPLGESFEQDLGVAAGVEVVAESLEFGAEFEVIADRPVQHQREPPVGGEHRLLAFGGRIEDGEPAMGEGHEGAPRFGRLGPADEAVPVGAPVPQLVRGPMDRAPGVAGVAGREDPGDAAHQAAWSSSVLAIMLLRFADDFAAIPGGPCISRRRGWGRRRGNMPTIRENGIGAAGAPDATKAAFAASGLQLRIVAGA